MLLMAMPASTNSSELEKTGNATKDQESLCSSTTSSAAAPPGGCRQRSRIMTPMAIPTASAAASAVSGISMAQAVPINADTVLPPTTDHGCAKGLEGTANTRTALAPMGAMSHEVSCEPSHRLNKPVNKMPSAAPAMARHFSSVGIVKDAGRKRRSQACSETAIERGGGMKTNYAAAGLAFGLLQCQLFESSSLIAKLFVLRPDDYRYEDAGGNWRDQQRI